MSVAAVKERVPFRSDWPMYDRIAVRMSIPLRGLSSELKEIVIERCAGVSEAQDRRAWPSRGHQRLRGDEQGAYWLSHDTWATLTSSCCMLELPMTAPSACRRPGIFRTDHPTRS